MDGVVGGELAWVKLPLVFELFFTTNGMGVQHCDLYVDKKSKVNDEDEAKY